MKTTSVRWLMLAFCLYAGSSFAHHHQGDKGSLLALQGETEELWSQVSHSTLNYNVRNAVSRFTSAERNLIYCGQNNVVEDHHLGDIGVPPACRSYLYDAVNAFRSVDYYLSDATEYPVIYDVYVDTRDMLFALH